MVLEERILGLMASGGAFSSAEVHTELGTVALATVKRAIKALVDKRYLLVKGSGKATRYSISPSYSLLHTIEIEAYFQQEQDARQSQTRFNHDLLDSLLLEVELFSTQDLTYLQGLQARFAANVASLTKAEYAQEFERLAIDLSWKSSQIEGNTYSLLETELLLKEQLTAKGKTKDEATMLLNHKAALDLLVADTAIVRPITVAVIEDIHAVLVQGLAVPRNLRNRRVGISGTNYVPLDNDFQIREALDKMCQIINGNQNPFIKAFLGLVLISYIQPFADGNKRTARIVCNALLMEAGHCPLSFRTVDSLTYKMAMLIFYEQNNVSATKRIFMEQYAFAVNAYF